MSLRLLVTLKLRIEFKRSAGGVGSISEEACLNPPVAQKARRGRNVREC